MKESFYLRHDYNSRNDERVLKLRAVMNIEGYGLFWMILEKLAESSEGRLKLEDIPSIAYELHSESKRITDAIRLYGLFEYDDTYFWSNRLMRDLQERNEKSKKAILANKIRWDKQRKELQTDSKRSPNGIQDGIQGKEKKGKESKGNTINSSKEELAKTPNQYGDEKINKLLQAIKMKIGIQDFADSQKWQRIYAKNLLSLMEKISPPEFSARLDSLLKDDFKRKRLNELRFIYEQIKGFIPQKQIKIRSIS